MSGKPIKSAKNRPNGPTHPLFTPRKFYILKPKIDYFIQNSVPSQDQWPGNFAVSGLDRFWDHFWKVITLNCFSFFTSVLDWTQKHLVGVRRGYLHLNKNCWVGGGWQNDPVPQNSIESTLGKIFSECSKIENFCKIQCLCKQSIFFSLLD